MPDYLEKPKRNSTVRITPLGDLPRFSGVKPTLFDFTIDFPISFCATRLKDMERQRGIFGHFAGSPKIEVGLQQQDAETYWVHVQAQRGVYLPISFLGYIVQQTDVTSLITGTVTTEYTQWQSRIQFSIFAAISMIVSAIIKILFPLSPDIFVIAVALWICTIPVYFVLAAFDRRGFIRFLEDSISFGKYTHTGKQKN